MVGNTEIFDLYEYAADPDGDYFYLNHISDPEHGNAHKENDSSFSITILHNYSGIDSCKVGLAVSESKSFQPTYFKFNVEYNPEFPMALNDTSIAYQGDTVYIPVLLNDFDAQNDELKIFDTNKEFYSLYLEYSDSTIVIVPKATADTGFHLAFTYQNAEYENPNHISNEAPGFLEILKNPNLPQATNDTATVVAGFPVNIPVLVNDEDINGDSLIISNAVPGNSLGISTFTDSVVSFTPFSNLSGWHTFSYKVQEKHNAAHYAFGSIVANVIENTNQPVAVNDTITIQAYQTIQFNPLLNDIDPNGMPIKIDQFYFNNAYVNIQLIGDSIINLTSKINCEASINIPYSYYRTNNPAMLSNEATITINITPDESMFYGVCDTIRGPQGLSGTINLIENDYNPGNDTLILQYAKSDKGLKIIQVNDSVIKYTIEFSTCSPVEGYYIFSDIHDSIRSAGKIYLDIQKPSPLIDTLDVNNIRASFSAVGMNFYDPIYDQGLFEVPKGSGKHTIAQNSLWIGGKSVYTLHVAAETWRLNGADFWPGPISEDYQNDDLSKYKVWKIKREEINYHLSHYKDPNYIPIESIATWPGNGNMGLGQAQQLAPFFDQDSDGIYEPLSGDVPQIRGDQSLYFIFNDDYGYHSESGGVPMKIEIHGNAYAFDQPDDSALFNTIFLHYDFINRSEYTYKETYIGMHNYFELGYPFDNFIRCDVSRGNAYVYNANKIDGNGEPFAYGPNPPVQGVTILGGASMPDDFVDNPSGGCDESTNGLNFDDGIIDNERMGMTRFGYKYYTIAPEPPEPDYASEYYNWLTGRWNDNTEWRYGANGHINNPETAGPKCNFILPGNSDPMNWGTGCEFPNGGYNQNGYYWTEETEGHQPGYRYGASITGPFTFAPGEMQSLDVAYVYARDNDTTDQLSAIDIMNQRIDTIRQRVQNGGIIYFPDYNVRINENSTRNLEIPVFPNPVSDEGFYIDLRQINYTGEAQFFIHDMMGRTIQNGFLSSGKINPIQIPGIKSGIYVIVIKLGDNTAIQKLVIRR